MRLRRAYERMCKKRIQLRALHSEYLFSRHSDRWKHLRWLEDILCDLMIASHNSPSYPYDGDACAEPWKHSSYLLGLGKDRTFSDANSTKSAVGKRNSRQFVQNSPIMRKKAGTLRRTVPFCQKFIQSRSRLEQCDIQSGLHDKTHPA